MQVEVEFHASLPIQASQCIGFDDLRPSVKRACFSVGMSCPSFGGQRKVSGGSIRLLPGLATSLEPSLFTQRATHG
jgi:hypothetical protein